MLRSNPSAAKSKDEVGWSLRVTLLSLTLRSWLNAINLRGGWGTASPK